MSTAHTIGVVGARGHVGAELLPLLCRHPQLRLAACLSRSVAGQRVADVLPACATDLRFSDADPDAAAALELDAWVLALPNGEAAPFVERIAARRPQAVLVDVSADYRFDDGWSYGLVERNRAALRGARRIANPGCYATGMQLALGPLLPLLAEDELPVVFGVSGYSGAGTTPSPRNDVAQLRDNLMPYALSGHLHQHEASYHLDHPLHFIPHVAPFFRGITLTLALPLGEAANAAELTDRLRGAYQHEPLIRVINEIPLVRDIAGHHEVVIGGCAVSEHQRAVLIATLDNLLKGAATQTLQNLNLALGHEELMGIRP